MKKDNIEIELTSEEIILTKSKKRKVRIHRHPLIDKLTEIKARNVVKAYLKSKKGSNA